MERNSKASKQISEIHQMMQRSSKFISLSGLSGIFAGLAALMGAAAIFISPYKGLSSFVMNATDSLPLNGEMILSSLDRFLAVDGIVVLLVALASSIFFTTRRAKKNAMKIWDSTTKRMLINLALPLIAGGIFCLALYNYGLAVLVPATTLIFYGLALLQAGKFTFEEVRLLGISELLLGLLSLFLIRYSLVFWIAGFGLLHIVYGALMYSKYERVGRPRVHAGKGQ